MWFYCIRYQRKYVDGGSIEHEFFVYAKTRAEAIKRFCATTGYKSDCIISVHVI